MAAAKAPEKWKLVAYPPTGPLIIKDEKTRSNRTTALWSREYGQESSAYRAVAPVRRMYPGCRVEIVHFELKAGGAYWGSVGHADRLEFCPGCGRMLNCSMGDIWHCPGCGDEWDPDVTTAWRAKTREQ
jgi:hypothetical protein